MQKMSARVETVSAAANELPKQEPVVIPTFTVDLDVAAEERWKEVISYYKEMGAIEAITAWNASAPHLSYDDEQAWLAALKPWIDEEYMREIDGWVKYAGDQNVTKDGMIIANFMYEQNYPVFCSGLLAAMPNGTVVHGRNMDYALFVEANGKKWTWQELTIDVVFVRAGSPLFNSVTWPGQLGVNTAMRFGGWTVDQQTRRLGDDLQLNLAAARNGGQSGGLLARRLMETVPDFETAVQRLWAADLIAPQYFVLAGAGAYEGAVLSVDRGGAHGTSSPPLLRLKADEAGTSGSWHMIQTNDDIGYAPKDPRRPIEERKLSNVSQEEVSLAWMTQEMHAFPLDAPETVFSWVASPAMGYSRTMLHEGQSAVAKAANQAVAKIAKQAVAKVAKQAVAKVRIPLPLGLGYASVD